MSPQERQQDELRELKKRWQESEWRIQFLRSFSGQQQTRPSDEQLRQWEQRNRTLCSIWQIPPA
jgi:hypothetical protein